MERTGYYVTSKDIGLLFEVVDGIGVLTGFNKFEHNIYTLVIKLTAPDKEMFDEESVKRLVGAEFYYFGEEARLLR